MTWKTHMMGGVLAGALFLEYIATPFSDTESLILLGTASMAALLPDADERKSKVGKALPIISYSMAATNCVLRTRAFFSKGEKKRELYEKARNAGHRGILHYLFTWVILSALLIGISLCVVKESNLLLSWAACLGASIGYLSHLSLDMLSGHIALLYPLCKRKIGIELIPQGGFMENVITRGLIMFAIIMTIK